MRNASLLVAAFAFPYALAGSPSVVLACSGVLCSAPSGHPATATLPANAGGVFLNPGNGTLAEPFPPPSLRITPLGGAPADAPTSVQDQTIGPFHRVAVRTSDTLPVGATLTLRAADRCDESSPDAGTLELADLRSWTVTSAVPLPTELGTIDVDVTPSGTVPQATTAGSCDEPVRTSYASVTLALASGAAPWGDTFVYETLVDGIVFLPVVTLSPFNSYSSQSQLFGASWVGRGVDRVFARCGDMLTGVEEGSHTIAMRGVLPDGTEVVTPSVQVTLSCPPDGGTPYPDSDAGMTTMPQESKGLCAVGGTGARDRSSIVGLTLAALVLLRSRRRRARRA